MKRKIIINLSLLLLLGLITGCSCSKKKQENKIITNKNKEFNKTQIVQNIEISNINLTYENGVSTFTAIVTNKGENKKIGIIDIIIKDENKKEIITLKGMIDRELQKDNSADINASTGIDLTDAKYIEYKIN